jgi:hypothetical protein
MSGVELCGINLRSSGAKVRVNRGGLDSLIKTRTFVRMAFSGTMSTLILNLGDGIHVVRPPDAAIPAIGGSIAVTPQSRSAPGKVPLSLIPYVC